MITCDVKCTSCGEDSVVAAKEQPNFCSLCGSKDIVIRSTLGEARSTHPSEPVDKCELSRWKAPVNEDGTSQVLERQQEPVECQEAGLDDTPTFFNVGDCEDFGTLDNFTFEVKNAPAQGTDEWLAWRKDGITATEAATLMFPDQHSTPMKVYTDKLGITKSNQSDPDGFFEWGHILEDDLVRKFKSVHPELADSVSQGRLYQRGFAKCSLDAQCVKDGRPVIVECKSSQSMSKWNPIPDRYFAQVQWQMFVSGIHSAIIIAVICEGGYHYIEREVQYSEIFVKQMVEKAQELYNCIQSKTPPVMTLGGFEPDKKAVAALHGEVDKEELKESTEVTREEIEEYYRLKAVFEKAQEEFEECKNTLGMKMMGSRRATCEGKTFASWVERKGSVSVDAKKLQEFFPEAYEACKKEGLPSRYVKYNKISFA